MKILLQSVGLNQTMMHEHFWAMWMINKKLYKNNLSTHSILCISSLRELWRFLCSWIVYDFSLRERWILLEWLSCEEYACGLCTCKMSMTLDGFVVFGSKLHGIDKFIWFKRNMLKNILTNKLNYTRLFYCNYQNKIKGL